MPKDTLTPSPLTRVGFLFCCVCSANPTPKPPTPLHSQARWWRGGFNEFEISFSLRCKNLPLKAPSPSPSGRGEQNDKLNSSSEQENANTRFSEKEAVYRAAASEVVVQIARDLRQRETAAEDILWLALRNRRLNNLKFRRQHPIANTAFVADFLCYEARLIIELDGEIHQNQQEADENRQAAIESEEYTFLRFTNDDVKRDLESVLTRIAEIADQLIKARKSPSP